jgi:transcription elongation GreA/GreB family factor
MKSKLEVKTQLYNQCSDFIEQRLSTIKSTINDIQESLDSETKSSAGDKHETGRAMLQIELEKACNQLSEIQKIKEVLRKIELNKTAETVCLGSVVYTSISNYFIGISAGTILVDNQQFYAIAKDTPIGQILAAKRVGDEVNFRDKTFKIEKVF